MSAPLLRPIDICDVCDDLFPLVAITDKVKVLTFRKILVTPGNYARVHVGACEESWRNSHETS